MRTRDLLNIIRERIWLQYVITIAPIALIGLYLVFYISDLINISGTISYNDSILEFVDEEYIYPVTVKTVDDEYYVDFPTVPTDGSNTVKFGEQILSCKYRSLDTYELTLGDTKAIIEHPSFAKEFNIEQPKSGTDVFDLYLTEDGNYEVRFKDGSTKIMGSISFLQFEKNGNEYTFTPLYVKVFNVEDLPIMMVSTLDEVGYYYDGENDALLYNNPLEARDKFIGSSNIVTILIAFLFYVIIIFMLSRQKDIKICNNKFVVPCYITIYTICFVAFIITLSIF